MNTTALGGGLQMAISELSVSIVFIFILACFSGFLLLTLLIRMVVTAQIPTNMFISKHKWIIVILFLLYLIASTLEFSNFFVRFIRSILYLANVNVADYYALFYILAQSFTLWMGTLVLALAVFISFIFNRTILKLLSAPYQTIRIQTYGLVLHLVLLFGPFLVLYIMYFTVSMLEFIVQLIPSTLPITILHISIATTVFLSAVYFYLLFSTLVTILILFSNTIQLAMMLQRNYKRQQNEGQHGTTVSEVHQKQHYTFRCALVATISFTSTICIILACKLVAYVFICIGAIIEHRGFESGRYLFIIGNIMIVLVIYGMLIMGIVLYSPCNFKFVNQIRLQILAKVEPPKEKTALQSAT